MRYAGRAAVGAIKLRSSSTGARWRLIYRVMGRASHAATAPSRCPLNAINAPDKSLSAHQGHAQAGHAFCTHQAI
jgi:hypothetical protein